MILELLPTKQFQVEQLILVIMQFATLLGGYKTVNMIQPLSDLRD